MAYWPGARAACARRRRGGHRVEERRPAAGIAPVVAGPNDARASRRQDERASAPRRPAHGRQRMTAERRTFAPAGAPPLVRRDPGSFLAGPAAWIGTGGRDSGEIAHTFRAGCNFVAEAGDGRRRAKGQCRRDQVSFAVEPNIWRDDPGSRALAEREQLIGGPALRSGAKTPLAASGRSAHNPLTRIAATPLVPKLGKGA